MLGLKILDYFVNSLDHEHAEREEVDRSAFREHRVIVFPDDPREKVHDDGVVESDEHPAVEISPAKEFVAGYALVEWRLTEKQWSNLEVIEMLHSGMTF